MRIALEFKGIKYKYEPINLLAGEQRDTDSYAKINPMKAVPSYVDTDGTEVSQSVAILEYLEETHPEPALLPSTPKDRAAVRRIVNCIACDIQPIQNLKVLNEIGTLVGNQQKVPWAQKWIVEGFTGVENILTKTAGKYCVGDQISFADICLVPQIYNAVRFSVDLSQFPIISRIGEALKEVPEFQRADPSKMPDAQA